jgi:hypothetical protein
MCCVFVHTYAGAGASGDDSPAIDLLGHPAPTLGFTESGSLRSEDARPTDVPVSGWPQGSQAANQMPTNQQLHEGEPQREGLGATAAKHSWQALGGMRSSAAASFADTGSKGKAAAVGLLNKLSRVILPFCAHCTRRCRCLHVRCRQVTAHAVVAICRHEKVWHAARGCRQPAKQPSISRRLSRFCALGRAPGSPVLPGERPPRKCHQKSACWREWPGP